MARANVQLHNDAETVRLYQILLKQMNSSNNADPIFSSEAINITAQIGLLHNSAINNHFFSCIHCLFFAFSHFNN